MSSRKRKKTFRKSTSRTYKDFFWIGPDLYIFLIPIDLMINEVWVARDSWGRAQKAAWTLVDNQTDWDSLSNLPRDIRDDVLETINCYLTYNDEYVKHDGDNCTFEYRR